jgi:hypothetical protein
VCAIKKVCSAEHHRRGVSCTCLLLRGRLAERANIALPYMDTSMAVLLSHAQYCLSRMYRLFCHSTTCADAACTACACTAPVQVHYLLQPCADYVQAAVEAVVDIHREDVPGDVLVFLTGVTRTGCVLTHRVCMWGCMVLCA